MSTDLWKPRFRSAYYLLGNTLPRRFRELHADHPLHIAARTYALSLSLSLGPALIPIFTTGGFDAKKYGRFSSTLRKELGASGFAFAMTTAVGGGAAMEYYWQRLAKTYSDQASDAAPLRSKKNFMSNAELSPIHRTLLCHVLTSSIAIALMQTRRRSSQTLKASIPLTVPITPERSLGGKASGTLDLTLLLLVRALDSLVQGAFQRIVREQVDHTASKGERSEDPGKSIREVRRKAATMTDKLDAIVFWLASARIMWCFFHRQERLPRSYVKWIGTLANVDGRLLEALRRRRSGTWTYGERTSHRLLESLAEELGYPSSWGNTLELPPTGECANKVWERLGVKGRAGVGGLPCEMVHGGVGGYVIPGGVGASCCANMLVRCSTGFLEALAIYAPVHFLPILLFQPSKLLSFLELRKIILALTRSSLFLSVFITSIWSAVCFTRTLVIARIFPRISHNFIDGPFGCILAGCLACGGSIWIEQGKRRGEIALYVLPRALRSMLGNSWLRSGTRNLKLMERLTFVLSLATILTASRHHPETLRGLSRWTVMYVLKGTGGRSSG